MALISQDQKVLFAEADIPSLWTRLNKEALRGKEIPDEWQDMIHFLRCLIKKDPAHRITAREALQYPFIVKNADRLQTMLR